jgi:hypothetical protein
VDQEKRYPRCPACGYIPDMLLQFGAAKVELGMAIVSCFIADREPALMRVPPGRLCQSMPAWVLTHPELKTTERVRVCVWHLVDGIKDREALITGQQPSA